MDLQPLFSIIVITYNSERYILETLESVRAQTYQKIELIISDDGSRDNTVVICKNWLQENKERFVHSNLLTVGQNTGIPANCNRGVKAVNGEWIKLIAGDDAFFEYAIFDFVKLIQQYPQYNVVQTNLLMYLETFTDDNLMHKKGVPSFKNFFKLKADNQFFQLQFTNPIQAPAVFFKKAIINSVNGFDEDFPKIEDYPMWLKLTSNGEKIYFLDIITCKYRLHSNSVRKDMKNLTYKNHIINRLEYIKKSNKLSQDVLFYYKIVEVINILNIKGRAQKILLLPIVKVLYYKFKIVNSLKR